VQDDLGASHQAGTQGARPCDPSQRLTLLIVYRTHAKGRGRAPSDRHDPLQATTPEISTLLPDAPLREHIAEVQAEIPARRLLTFDLREGWWPLCGFLGVEVPDDMPFPKTNSSKAFVEEEWKQG
jgi:hypothetical protein